MDVRLKPKYTECTVAVGITRHTDMIRVLGKCRFCNSDRLYAGDREEMLEELSTAFLALYVDRSEEATWGVEDTFFAAVLNLAEEELPEHVREDCDLEVDYDTEGLRIVRQALLRAAGKIEAHLNSAGEDV